MLSSFLTGCSTLRLRIFGCFGEGLFYGGGAACFAVIYKSLSCRFRLRIEFCRAGGGVYRDQIPSKKVFIPLKPTKTTETQKAVEAPGKIIVKQNHCLRRRNSRSEPLLGHMGQEVQQSVFFLTKRC